LSDLIVLALLKKNSEKWFPHRRKISSYLEN